MTLSDSNSAAAPDTVPPPELRHRVMAGFTGNVVEWYDFALFGYMAGVIAPVFFPQTSQAAGLIATYGIFAAGFLMRPLGSAFFGWYGDRFGRAHAMLLSVAMMAFPTLLLGLLPGHAQIGLLAPALLVVVRMVQGLSVGGEFSSSVTYLVETAPQRRRGFMGSWANVGSMFGMLLGAGAAAATTGYFGTDALAAWAWRLPFLGGGVIGVIAVISRLDLIKSERFKAYHDTRPDTSPLLEAFTTNRRETILALVFASGYAISFYIGFVYLPEWIATHTGVSRDLALLINTVATALIIPLLPLSGLIGDRVFRRKTWIMLALAGLGVAAWPLYLWMASGGGVAAVVVTHLVLFTLLAGPLGSSPAFFVEMFPSRDRLSGYSVAFNLGMGFVGGTTPMVAAALTTFTGMDTAPALYLAFGVILAVTALRLAPDHSRGPLP